MITLALTLTLTPTHPNRPHQVTYAVMINAYVRAGEWQRGLALLDEMLAKQVRARARVRVRVRARARVRVRVRARLSLALLDEMLAKQVEPDGG